jgi:hypothetical protein
MDICTAIIEICKDKKSDAPSVSVNGEDHSQITWHDDNPNKITVDQIKAKQAELQKIYDGLAYSRARSEAYPSWEKQLEKIYDDGVDKWKSEMVDPVKAAHPKPE